MNICVLVVDDMFDTGLTTILDTWAVANELAAQVGTGTRFKVAIASVRQSVRTRLGLQIPTTLTHSLAPPDLVVVPALADKTPETLTEALQRRDVRDAQAALERWYLAGTQVAAACTGTYILAATGLLDGVRATTTWWLAPDFRQRFPQVMLDDSQMLVVQEQRVTAGAALAHIDLALWIVRQQSPELAHLVSRYLMVDGRPSQAVYAMVDHLAHNDSLIEHFERWARQNLSRFTMKDAAAALGASERTLQRRIRDVLGRTPIAFVRDLRVEQAIYRLQTTNESIEEIAEAVGYHDGVTLRTLLRAKTGCGVRDLRNAGSK